MTTTKSVAIFAVFGFDNIVNVILKHFESYPLQSAKRIDYYFWRECVYLKLKKEHAPQTLKGLTKIVSNKFTINFGESKNLKESFPNATPKNRSLIDCSITSLNPFWVTGFIEAEGSFFVTLRLKIKILI